MVRNHQTSGLPNQHSMIAPGSRWRHQRPPCRPTFRSERWILEAPAHTTQTNCSECIKSKDKFEFQKTLAYESTNLPTMWPIIFMLRWRSAYSCRIMQVLFSFLLLFHYVIIIAGLASTRQHIISIPKMGATKSLLLSRLRTFFLV